MSSVHDGDANCNSSVNSENLIIHVETETFVAKKNSKYDKKMICSKCDLTFSARRSLLSHNKRFHPEDVSKFIRKTKVLCPLCDCDNKTIFDLHDHFQEKHTETELNFEYNEFFTWEDFDAWKANTEKNSLSLFLKRRAGITLADGRNVVHYYCHRSGCYTPMGTGRRQIKRIGSNKINKSCPAHMTVHSETCQDITLISVQYQSVHVGHGIDIERFTLSKTVRTSNLRSKLGVKDTNISKCRRKKTSCSTTKNVIENIQADFNDACEENNSNSSENVAISVQVNQCNDYVNEKPNETYFIQQVSENAFHEAVFSIMDQKAMILSKFITLINKSKTNEEMKIMLKCVNSMESMLASLNGDALTYTLNPVTEQGLNNITT